MKSKFLLLIFLIVSNFSIAQHWKNVGGGVTGGFYVNGSNEFGIYCEAIDSSNIYVGGAFTNAGGIVAKNVAKWNGVNWSALGNGIPNMFIGTMALLNDTLYVANPIKNKVMRWDGTSWSTLPLFTAGSGVDVLKVINGQLYAGGTFYGAPSSGALNNIARWNGVKWDSLGGGLRFPTIGCYVMTIAEYQGKIVVGGQFDRAGNTPVRNIAIWDGVKWDSLGHGLYGNDLLDPLLNSYPLSLLGDGNLLYAGGEFDSAGYSIYANGFAVWDGNTWNSVINAPIENHVVNLQKLNGNFLAAGTAWSNLGYLVKINGSNISPFFSNEFAGGMGGVDYFKNEYYEFNSGDTCSYNSSFYPSPMHYIGRSLYNETTATISICGNNCNGTATATATGVSPQTYLWSNGETTQMATGLCAGVYTVSVTDASGSPSIGTVTVSGPPAILFSQSNCNSSCATCNDGSATVSASGGVGILHYQWSNGDTTTSITNQLPGMYMITITDNISCAVTDTFYIGYNTIVSVTGQNSACYASCNGTVTATSNGVPPFNYQWSNGDSTQTIVSLCSGTYSVTVTDSSGSFNINTLVISAPSAIQLTSTIINASCGICADGNIDISASGGVSPLSYQWSNGATTDTLTNLTYGSYYLTITDSNNCSLTDTFLIAYSNTIQTQSTIIKCYGECTGTASATINGVPPFIYEWDNVGTTQTIANLCSGAYIVTVTDSNGVTVTDTAVINSLPQIAFTDTTTNASCPTCTDGNATINNTNGGTPPYSYLWSNGATTSSIDSLLQGVYTVTVTDNNNCLVIDSVTVGFDIGINESTIYHSQLTISPNPASNEININCNSKINSATIYNLIGEKIFTNQKCNANQLNIDVKDFSSGLYFIEVETTTATHREKFIKN